MAIRRTPQRGEKMEDQLRRKLRAAVAQIASQAVGMIQRRTAKGKDKDGSAFARYSASYAKALQEGGESTLVDLTVTGAYLADIGIRKTDETATGITVTIGPGSGTSEQRDFQDGQAKHTGRRSPAHNQLAVYLERKRKIFGLTPDERKRLASALRTLLSR